MIVDCYIFSLNTIKIILQSLSKHIQKQNFSSFRRKYECNFSFETVPFILHDLQHIDWNEAAPHEFFTRLKFRPSATKWIFQSSILRAQKLKPMNSTLVRRKVVAHAPPFISALHGLGEFYYIIYAGDLINYYASFLTSVFVNT